MSQKSHVKGDPFPPLAKGKLRLYNMRFCPFGQRARLVLAHKGIEHETINVDLKKKPEWFLERNPKGLVPTIEQDDKVVYESLVVSDYLDQVYSKNPLTPADPYRKARDSMFVDFYGNKMIPNYYKVLRTEGKDDEAKEDLASAFKAIDEELKARGKYLGGASVAMVDLMVWPWLERLGLLSSVAPDLIPSKATFPNLAAYIVAMLEVPAVKATIFDLDTHLKFVMSFKAGNPDYDLGLEP